jgi:hypothetical protein
MSEAADNNKFNNNNNNNNEGTIREVKKQGYSKHLKINYTTIARYSNSSFVNKLLLS